MSAKAFSLQSLIRTEAAADPAFVFDGTPVSRAEFSEKIEQTAAWLAAKRNDCAFDLTGVVDGARRRLQPKRPRGGLQWSLIISGDVWGRLRIE